MTVLKPFSRMSGIQQVLNRSWGGPRLTKNIRNLTAPRVSRSVQDIPAICKKMLNIAAYGTNIFTFVGRQVTAASLFRYMLREFKRHKHMVDNHNDPEYLPELSKTFTIMKLLYQMPTHLI